MKECYICKKEIKKNEWCFSFNKGLCCGDCKEIGKINQDVDMFQENLQDKTENLKYIFNGFRDVK